MKVAVWKMETCGVSSGMKACTCFARFFAREKKKNLKPRTAFSLLCYNPGRKLNPEMIKTCFPVTMSMMNMGAHTDSNKSCISSCMYF